jgi:hypothetical protein
MRQEDLDLFPGYARRAVRGFCRELGPNRTFACGFVIEHFGADLLEGLIAKGVVEPDREYTGKGNYDGPIIPGRYRLARLGLQLAHVRLQKPVPRAKAEQIVSDMIKRARAINRNPELPYRVEKIVAIGSYLTKSKDLGDIDLGVELDRKTECFEKHEALVIARARAKAPFRHFYCMSNEFDYVRREVLLLLKNRNRYISFIRSYDDLDTPKRVIFEFVPKRSNSGSKKSPRPCAASGAP